MLRWSPRPTGPESCADATPLHRPQAALCSSRMAERGAAGVMLLMSLAPKPTDRAANGRILIPASFTQTFSHCISAMYGRLQIDALPCHAGRPELRRPHLTPTVRLMPRCIRCEVFLARRVGQSQRSSRAPPYHRTSCRNRSARRSVRRTLLRSARRAHQQEAKPSLRMSVTNRYQLARYRRNLAAEPPSSR
jgi:hypothetical protein